MVSVPGVPNPIRDGTGDTNVDNLEVSPVAESILELFNEDPTHRFSDDRELHKTLLFRYLVPEEVTLATVKTARESLQ